MTYFARHIQAGLYSLGKLSRRPFASLMTCLIIGVALALPAILFITLKNAERMNGGFQKTLEVTLYLKQDAKASDAHSLVTRLNHEASIQTVRAISPADALKELQQQAGFGAGSDSLLTNPLPWTIVITPDDAINTPERFNALRDELQQLPFVDIVQMDDVWVNRLTSFITLANRLLYALSLFLGLGVLLIVNNTIRSITEQHHREIEIMKLIGGTDAFIRRPFLYVGLLYGLFGGILAGCLVTLLMVAVKGPSQHLAALYDSSFRVAGLDFYNVLILLGGSTGLGLLGSWFAVTKYLRQ
ncbi:MAG TPA: permease-like cell division protein FtsX [Gammaproteobacteria bacterium]|nr:permease-like cell division protein FtsX [Gammaproteobacteria bacterium]